MVNLFKHYNLQDIVNNYFDNFLFIIIMDSWNNLINIKLPFKKFKIILKRLNFNFSHNMYCCMKIIRLERQTNLKFNFINFMSLKCLIKVHLFFNHHHYQKDHF